jgi:4'-phosphopantetheinyl transferase EntD
VTSVTPRQQRIQAYLQAILGPGLSVVCTGVEGDTAGLWPEEETAVAGAILKRKREFAAGRAAAREAMRRLIGIEAPISVNPDRSPRWPAGIVGSISHAGDTCLAVAGSQESWLSIGIDVEPNLGIEESLWGLICSPDELRIVDQAPQSRRATQVREVFVAKEAFYKWHYPQKLTIFDFQDVSVHRSLDGRGFTVTARDWIQLKAMERLEGQLLTIEDHVIAVCAATQT